MSIFAAAVLVCHRAASADWLTPDELVALRDAKPGAVLRLTELSKRQRELPSIPIALSDAHGPQFLFSDKPEYFRGGNGIALQESVKPGVVRLYIYHVPEPSGAPKVISSVIENLGTESLTIRFLRYASPKPGTDYPRIAREALLRYFSSTPEITPRHIPPHGRIALDPKMDETTATKDQLVHGFYEFEIDQPARISVSQRDPAQSSAQALDTLPKLSRMTAGKATGNGAGRGLFLTSDFLVTNKSDFVCDTADGPQVLIVGGGKGQGWIQGHDGIENSEDAHDAGNYGVIYRIHIARRSTDGRALALLLCKSGPLQGGCGKVGAAVRVSEGLYPGGIVALPGNQSAFGEPGEVALIQKFGPVPKGKTETIEIIYSPPGAACMPTPFLLVPYER